MKFRDVVRLREFERDLKYLCKRYPTLEGDLDTLIEHSLTAFHRLGIDTGIVRIDDLGKARLPIYKARRVTCRALKGRGSRTGIRVIYAFDQESDRIELIEIYIKSDQENEDRERIRRHYG